MYAFFSSTVCVCVVGKGDEGIGPEVPTGSRSTQWDPGQTGSKVWYVNMQDCRKWRWLGIEIRLGHTYVHVQ